jgi:hypothetical protein
VLISLGGPSSAECWGGESLVVVGAPTLQSTKHKQKKEAHTHTHTHTMSRCHPTPSGFALSLSMGRAAVRPNHGAAAPQNQKIERGMGRLHCGGRHLKGGHNNQIKVGFDIGGDVGEETRQGRNVWGGVVSRNRASNRRRKKNNNKTRRGLRWLLTSSKDATTNQKYAGATGEG